MKIAAAGAEGDRLSDILEKTIGDITFQMGAETLDLGFVFISDRFEADAEKIAYHVRSKTGIKTLLGCTGESVIGPAFEYERKPSLSLWAASLPGANMKAFHLSPGDIKEAASNGRWKQALRIVDPSQTTLFVLGDPYSTDVESLLNGVNQHLPECPIVGGMASGGGQGQNALILNEKAHRFGAVCLSLSGDVKIETVVSQGCRPIGKPHIIAQSEQNVIQQLGIRTPMEIINEMYNTLPEADRALMSNGLFIGRVIDEYKDSFQQGDFLIRNLMGAEEESGAIAIMDRVKIGTTVQFHVRDAVTADEDLNSMLAMHTSTPPKGALLFSCNGRGTNLFARPHHDIDALRDRLAAPPAAGFFCAGELGPVGGKNFIHGHTASIALFKE